MNNSGLFLEEASLISAHGGSYRLVFGKVKLEPSEETRELISREKSIQINPRTIGQAILKYEVYGVLSTTF